MKIQQFEDKALAQFSYAVLSESTGQVVLVDPARDPGPYYDFARQHQARLVGVIETHPHADFVSAHLQIHQETGATLYVHSLVDAAYPHQPFDDGAELQLGDLTLRALHTPGHSPDSISIVLRHQGRDQAVFTGDTLFIGDVGRPDLRERAGSLTATRDALARQLYHSLRDKLMPLDAAVVLYPAHGAGTLCGKSLSQAHSSTIGAERIGNYALQPMSEEQFMQLLTEDQPFIPRYFGYDVDLNKQGAPAFQASIEKINRLADNFAPEAGALVVDTRSQQAFRKGHYPGALNIQLDGKFETWLGSLIDPAASFYLAAASHQELEEGLAKAARIGYELLIKGAFVVQGGPAASPAIDLQHFRQHPESYTIVDVRNAPEVKQGRFFSQALHIPLPELRERAHQVPTDKPVVVHCAGGYRSAAASSILEAALPQTRVLDLGEAVREFNK